MNKIVKKILPIVFLLILIIIPVSFSYVTKEEVPKIDIDKILKTNDYNYLPQSAKIYIEEMYEQSGSILLTEKNKKPNMPYLNPEYVEYLNYISNSGTDIILNEENELKYEVIPEELVIDYSFTSLTLDDYDIPSTFDLRNVNGKNFVTPNKDQDGTGLCWSFATIAQAESFLLTKNNTSYENGKSQIFSEMQIDYATADNGILDSSPLYNFTRNLGDGGNFGYAMAPMIDGLGLVDTSWKKFEEYDYVALEKNKVYKFSNSLYEVTSTVDYPKLNLSTLDLSNPENIALKKSYLSNLKKLIMENGGAYVGTGDPTGYCSTPINGHRFMYDDGKCASAGHAMQIIGWDDNFEYNICTGLKNSRDYYYISNDTASCTDGKIISGKGAWILKNSWGSSQPFVYLAYDSMDSSINLITELNIKNWDNYYSEKTNSDNMITYHKVSVNQEKLNKIKLDVKTQAHDYDIYLGTDVEDLTYYKSISISFPGIYTVDFSNENVLIDDNLVIKVVPVGGGSKPQTINVYTNSIEKTPQVFTENAEYKHIISDRNEYILRITSNTINLPENTIIDYKLFDQNRKEITALYYEENIVFANRVFSKLYVDKNVKKGKYILQTIINNEVLNESDITIEKDIIVTTGTGTETDPYIINTPAQLNLIRLNRFAFYKLGQDIDLTYDTQNEKGQFFNDGKGWEPIKYSGYSNSSNHYLYFAKGFSGGFDGNNHTIKGLYINRPDEHAVGLFSNIYNENYSNLHIKNVILEKPNVTGNSWVGSLLGVAYGTTYERMLEISNIQIKGGSVSGTKYVGGVIGLINAGSYLNVYGTTIPRHLFTDIYNSSTVYADNYAGGIFGLVTNINAYGENKSPVKVMYLQNNGNVTSNGKAGGLAGFVTTRETNDITISDSINTGIVSGKVVSSELIGEFSDVSVGNLNLNNIYYINSDNLNLKNSYIKKFNVSRKGISVIKLANTYSSWTSFKDHWKIAKVDNITRIPVLKIIDFDYTSIDDIVIANDVVNIYESINPNIEAAKNISYQIQDDTVANIDSNGNIVGIKNGETFISVVSNYDGYEKNVKITVDNTKSKIIFDSNGGSNVDTIITTIGESIDLPINPIKNGYLFDGWYTDNETFNNKFEFDKMPSKTTTLYAKWLNLNVEVSTYQMDNNMIIDIPLGISINDYLKKFIYDKDLEIKIYNYKNEEIKDYNKNIGTGSNIEFYAQNNLIATFTNVVKADITGDGISNLSDLSRIFNYYRKNITMTDIYLRAADVTNDGDVNLRDLSKYFNFYRGNIKDI